jgi:hypothetical protein
MKKFLILISAFAVFILVYYALFHTFNHRNDYNGMAIAEGQEFQSKAILLSMKQIDSLTASENFKFTCENYRKDVLPVIDAVRKNYPGQQPTSL